MSELSLILSYKSFLQEAFQGRKESFFHSLKKVLSSLAIDKYVKQMFENPKSTSYVPNRICEVVHIHIENERENYILQLETRLYAFQVCFSTKKLKKSKKLEDSFSHYLQMELVNLNSVKFFN